MTTKLCFQSMRNFDVEQENVVYGYARYCQSLLIRNELLKIIPNEIMCLCVLFYQTERLKVTASKFCICCDEDTVKTNFPLNDCGGYDWSCKHNIYITGSLKINNKMNFKYLLWKFKVIQPSPLKIGITADKMYVDTVLHINGDHRYHTLSYLGLLSSHRKTYSVQSQSTAKVSSVFPKNSIITMFIDIDKSQITFKIENENGEKIVNETEPQRINLCDEYKMIIYMASGHGKNDKINGCIQLLDFKMMDKLNDG